MDKIHTIFGYENISVWVADNTIHKILGTLLIVEKYIYRLFDTIIIN
ncbi:MAG: hypothetical protein KGJ90_04430 [Patescibacteria group bacterium]|nr:hypothetical protein [Patescibacteria group bacterium]